jgi:signal transduction histidine kinase
LLNFISNAVKFNKFGMIKLQTKLNESQNFWEISISDTGIGIQNDY